MCVRRYAALDKRPIGAAVRIGALLAPARTADRIARRFFVTSKPALHRARFTLSEPARSKLHSPDGEVMMYRWGNERHQPTVILVHGWNGRAQQMEHFIAPLQQHGFAVLAFDHVAHGASPGSRASLPVMIRTFEQILAETPQPIGVIAHSLGAAAVASALVSSRRELQGAVLIAPPSDPRPYLSMLARMLGAPAHLMPAIQQSAERLAGVEFKRLVADPWLIRRIRTPLMIVHDVDDSEVPISNGYAFTLAARTRVLATDGLGHKRILRDLHVIDEAVAFVARRAVAQNEKTALIAA